MNHLHLERGLNHSEVFARLKKFGPNEIPQKKEYTALKIFFSQFTSALIIILIIAGIISLSLKETLDGLAIFAVVIINAVIGFIQEYKAENAVRALRKMVIPLARVLRDGQEKEIPIAELVPEDVVIISEGDKIPADLKIMESFSLKVDESMLTGESLPVSKKFTGGKEGLLYKGTIVRSGRAKAIVQKTGANTEFGKIVEMVMRQEKTRSPLSIQIDQLGKKLGIIILILISIVFIVGLIREISVLKILMTAVALGVSAIPEGMPIIVTLTLAMGVSILAKKRAIVRKMNAIETLGATTIICSDKTGTLTLNEMTVRKVFANFKETIVPGEGYYTKEKVRLDGPEEKKLLEICENCNNAFVDKTVLGDPTEIALKVLTRKANYVKSYKEIDENTFTSERKMMSTLNMVKGKKEIMTKGAFEEIIKKCSHIYKNGKVIKLSEKDRKELFKTAESYAKEALRVLGFAYRPYQNKFEEKNLIFVGLVGMLDPPHKTVKASLKLAISAGIGVIIITGDNPVTAKAIGEQVGLKVDKVIIGDDIDKMNDRELKKILKTTTIFARTSPQHKYRIVDLLKKTGQVVAVTGDGVNDAPALKHADVGVAMGIKGTEATKEVADIVLKDDNFSTIINAVEEGRRIYKNILAFIKYMLSANFGAITTVGILTLLGYPLPLLPLQILWINIATDTLPALALGASSADSEIMKEKPHPKEEKIFSKFIGFIMIAVIIQTAGNIILYLYGRNIDQNLGIDTTNLDIQTHARTIVFTGIVIFELFFAFVCKQEKPLTFKSIFSNKALLGAVTLSFLMQIVMIYVPFMQNIFKTAPLTFQEWALILAFSSSSIFVPRLAKIIKQIRTK